MSYSVEENIALYIDYFRQNIQLVEDHCPKSREGDLHSRILYTAILDALSRVLFIQKSNRERMVNLVEKFSDWPECENVSLSHLYQLTRTKTESGLAQLRDFAIRNMSQWGRAEVIPLNRDPTFTEVRRVWPHKNDKPILINGIGLHSLKHSHLFYTYRNSLIHEFRTAGYHAELFEKNEPYYIQVTEYRDEDPRELERSWQLQYTASFFKRLNVSAISNLEKHLLQNQIDPIEILAPEKYWIQGLDE